MNPGDVLHFSSFPNKGLLFTHSEMRRLHSCETLCEISARGIENAEVKPMRNSLPYTDQDSI